MLERLSGKDSLGGISHKHSRIPFSSVKNNTIHTVISCLLNILALITVCTSAPLMDHLQKCLTRSMQTIWSISHDHCLPICIHIQFIKATSFMLMIRLPHRISRKRRLTGMAVITRTSISTKIMLYHPETINTLLPLCRLKYSLKYTAACFQPGWETQTIQQSVSEPLLHANDVQCPLALLSAV